MSPVWLLLLFQMVHQHPVWLCVGERHVSCFCFSDIPSASFMVDILTSAMMGEEGAAVKPLAGSEVRKPTAVFFSWWTLFYIVFT